MVQQGLWPPLRHGAGEDPRLFPSPESQWPRDEDLRCQEDALSCLTWTCRWIRAGALGGECRAGSWPWRGRQRLACSQAHIYKHPFTLGWAFPIPPSCCYFSHPLLKCAVPHVVHRGEAMQPAVPTGGVGEQWERERLWEGSLRAGLGSSWPRRSWVPPCDPGAAVGAKVRGAKPEGAEVWEKRRGRMTLRL